MKHELTNTVLHAKSICLRNTVLEREQPGRCYFVSKKREQPVRCYFVSKKREQPGRCYFVSKNGIPRDALTLRLFFWVVNA
jgi:predicted RNA-binding protein YlxR (DUF448 family)